MKELIFLFPRGITEAEIWERLIKIKQIEGVETAYMTEPYKEVPSRIGIAVTYTPAETQRRLEKSGLVLHVGENKIYKIL